MVRRLGQTCIALLLAAVCAGAQTSIDERLKRIGDDVFAGGQHIDDDIAELKAILATDQRSATAHMLLGIAYRTKGSPDLIAEATGELRQAIAIDPTSLQARFYLAHMYLDLGRPERARDELQTALQQMPGQPQVLALLGESERQLGNPQKTLELTAQALKETPTFAEARYYQALALYDLKRRDEAITTLEQVVSEGGRRPEVYGSLGSAYLDAGRLDDAIRSLSAGLALEPTRVELLLHLARAYRLKGQLTKAETELSHARSVAGSGAVSAAEQQIQRDLAFEEGVVRLALGQLTAAATNLRKAVDLDGSYGPGRRYLAEVYLRQGLYDRARDQATRAAALGTPLPADLQKKLDDKLRAGGGKDPR